MNTECPECKGTHIIKVGWFKGRKGSKQRLQCKDCGRIFYLEGKG